MCGLDKQDFAIRSTVELKHSEPGNPGCPKGLTAKAKPKGMLTIVPSLIEGVETIRKEYMIRRKSGMEALCADEYP